MIPRYTRPEMAAIWEPEQRFRIWFEIEAHACDALAVSTEPPPEPPRPRAVQSSRASACSAASRTRSGSSATLPTTRTP